MIRKITLLLLIGFTFFNASAQKKDKQESTESKEVDTEAIAKLILDGINKMRTESGIDGLESHEILQKASSVQAADMAKNNKAQLENSKGKYKTTAKRVIAFGGTKNAEELVFGTPAIKGKNAQSSQAIADAVLAKWKTGKKEQVVIKNGNYVYASPAVALDETGKKAYISVVFGSFNTFNTGVKKRKELPVPYTSKNKKIKPYEPRNCKNCEKFKDYENLQKGLIVKDGKIILKYDNMKNFGKLIRKPKDGFAVDIIQKAQYDKPDYNIMDNNLLSKGVLLKTVYKDRLLSKNLAKPDKKGKKPNKLEVVLGKMPSGIKGPYELNLLVIQDGRLCKTAMRSYIEQGDQNSNTPLTMLLMPDSAAYFNPPFEPKSETSTLTFTVPFEKNKFDYKEEDMGPFLTALQEPDFLIDKLEIIAYSSIEGDATANQKLQKIRAESIVKALSKIQKAGVVANVKTSDSWNLFQLEMEDGKFDYLTKMTKEKAIKEINTKGLATELEPTLAKERFAKITMDVTYDIAGAKEEKFSIMKFNQAIKKGDIKQAEKIQYFIGKQMRIGKYSPEALAGLQIPDQAKYSGVLNNQVVLRYMFNNNVADDDDYAKMKKLSALDGSNNYILFNTLYCSVKLDSTIGDKKYQDDMQKRIDALYKSNIPKKFVDGLNTEWQFKIIDAMDTVPGGEPIIQACIDKVKSFYNIKESSWQNNLKLSYVFARFKDFKYAANLLAPFIKQDNVNEQVLFAYASFCAQVPELIKSQTFVTALEKAEKANHAKYCKLFGEPNLTFQVFDNPKVKADYNKARCK
jgi:uncharacterized protein YkwD